MIATHDKWVIINIKTKDIVKVLHNRKVALACRKELNAQAYFNCDKTGRYRIVENPAFSQ